MKKFFISVVSICFLCTAVIFPTYAKNLTISDAEAEELVQSALDLFYTLDDSILFSDDYKELDKNLYPPNTNYFLVDLSKLPGGSLEKFYEYVKTIYTDGVAQKYCSTSYLFDAPMFIVDEDGDVFMSTHTAGFPEINIRSFENAIIEVIDSNNQVATARVQIEKNVGKWDGFIWEATWIECKFENTQNGWRISECELFDILNSHSDYNGYSPSTADPSFDSFVILPAVSLACGILAACLMRRRRSL